jgi:glycosidase
MLLGNLLPGPTRGFLLILCLGLIVLSSLNSSAADFRREVIYQIVTDRFFDGDASNNDPPQSPGLYDPKHTNWDAYWGGDLEGIRQKIPYLAGLGVTVIWISPPADNLNAKIGRTAAYYGYQARDFKRVEEHFGDATNSWAAFDKLVASAHEWNIKVIVDFAPNHSSIYIVGEFGALYDNGVFLADFFHDPNHYFRHLGFINDPGDPYETQYFSLYGLSDIDQENPRMDDYLKSAARQFQAHGADGFRVDAIKHITWGWTYSLANSVNSYGDTFIFGEWYLENSYDPLRWDYAFSNSIYDAGSIFPFPETSSGSITDPLYHDAYEFANKSGVSLTDFPLNSAIRNVFGVSDADFSEIDSVITRWSEVIANPDGLVTFIDSHDATRFLSTYNNLDRHHESLAFLLTARGIPCLYYGAEQYLHNDTKGGQDPYNRPMMSNFSNTTTAYSLIGKLSALRRSNPALGYGSMVRRWINRDVYIYEREFFGSVVLVAINKSSSRVYDVGDLRTALPLGTYADYLGGQIGGIPIRVGTKVNDNNSVEGFTLPAHSVSVWSYLESATGPQIGSVYPSVGQPGIKVTISGQGFGPKPGNLKFGETEGKVNSWSDSEIKAIVPAIKGGENRIVVTTKTGKSSNEAPFRALTGRLTPVVVNLNGAPKINPGEHLFIVGDVAELGAWKATWDDSAGPMLTSNGTDWFLCVSLPEGQTIHFKFIVIDEGGSVRWSPDDVQTYLVPTSGVGQTNAVW